MQVKFLSKIMSNIDHQCFKTFYSNILFIIYSNFTIIPSKVYPYQSNRIHLRYCLFLTVLKLKNSANGTYNFAHTSLKSHYVSKAYK